MRQLIREFAGEESGATMIEYGLIAALVSVAAIFALTALGLSISDIFQSSTDAINSTTPLSS